MATMNRVQRSKKHSRSTESGLTGVVFRTVLDALRTLAAGPPPPIQSEEPTQQDIRNHRNNLIQYWDAAVWIFTPEQDDVMSFDTLVNALNGMKVMSFTPEWMRRRLREQGHDPFHWRLYVRSEVGGELGRGSCEQHIRQRNEVLAADAGYAATSIWDLVAACESALGQLADGGLRDDGRASGEPSQASSPGRIP